MTIAIVTPDLVWWEILLRMSVAVVCAGAIGFDREKQKRAAGLRTYMLVALGACSFTLVAMELIAAADGPEGLTFLDPAKIIAAIVGGIGFLGAGAIIQSGTQVHGLTTAAGLWVAAAIGMAAGSGFHVMAVIATVLAIGILIPLRLVERGAMESKEE